MYRMFDGQRITRDDPVYYNEPCHTQITSCLRRPER